MHSENGGNGTTVAQAGATIAAVHEAPKAKRSVYHSVEMRFAAAQRAIDGALSDATIGGVLALHNYSQARITGEGKQLLSQAMQAIVEQSRTSGEVFDAKDECDRVCQIARKQYRRDVTMARAVLRDKRGALERLALQNVRKADRTGWMMQARQFYRGALDDVALQQLLVEAALTPDKLEGGLGLINQIDHCLHVQDATRGAARAATQRRDEAMKRLDAWMKDFRGIARIALRDQPQLLAKLGL